MTGVRLFVVIASLSGVVYGLFRTSKEKMPQYFMMIVSGVGCAAMGRSFEVLQQLLSGINTMGFQIGILGVVGSILFLFTANQCLIDRLVDDDSGGMKKYRILGLIAPMFFLIMEIAVVLSGSGLEQNMVLGSIAFVAMLARYFHFKHLLLPDIHGELIRGLRGYNLTALLYETLCMGERLCMAYNAPMLSMMIVYILMGLSLAALIPILEIGVKKWTI